MRKKESKQRHSGSVKARIHVPDFLGETAESVLGHPSDPGGEPTAKLGWTKTFLFLDERWKSLLLGDVCYKKCCELF